MAALMMFCFILILLDSNQSSMVERWCVNVTVIYYAFHLCTGNRNEFNNISRQCLYGQHECTKWVFKHILRRWTYNTMAK